MTDAPTTPTVRGSIFGSFICRVLVPAWLLTGAAIKLSERSPMLLPSPVRDALKTIATGMGMGSESDFATFLDFMLRVIVSGEFALAAAMIMLPRISRAIAIPMLSLFVAILLTVVARGEASCGCFGSKGPPPWAVLIGDAVLLALAIFFRPLPGRFTKQNVGGFIALSAVGVAIAFVVPPKQGVAHATEPAAKHSADAVPAIATPKEATKSAEPVPAPKAPEAVNAGKPAVAPPVPTPPVAAATPWPNAPAQLQPYYLPQFEQWVGKPLRDQPVAALITRPIPADLEKGRWVVMFFREDCEHCHAVLDRHFTPKVPLPTLLVAVPDADPAASLPNPCSECQVRTLPKGPDWVIGTPVLLLVNDGVVKMVVSGTDAEDPAKVQAMLDAR
ncbi:MAG: hypothetical protein LW625_05745 [Planctomycetaceae bacterium]|nr:hypothetical protein [Planctomycetaceae bacterium]